MTTREKISKNLRWIGLACLCGLVLFSVSLFLFARRSGWYTKGAEVDALPPLINKPLPATNLVDSAGVKLEEQVLRKGKVLLVFVAANCPPCESESQFLRAVVSKRKDMSVYAVVSFGVTKSGMKSIEGEFPFKVYLDMEPRLAGALGLYRVPIKVFIEDGIIRKSWKGATTDEGAKTEFAKWLDDLN